MILGGLKLVLVQIVEVLIDRIRFGRVHLGDDVGDPDGRIGSRTRDAIRDFQERAGLRPDGYPNRRVLEALQTR